jgi:hypothetical protein
MSGWGGRCSLEHMHHLMEIGCSQCTWRREPAARPVGGDTRESLREVARAISDPGAVTPRAEGESVSRWSARAVLALPAVRDALAAQETVRVVQGLLDAPGYELAPRQLLDALRRAVDGDR